MSAAPCLNPCGDWYSSNPDWCSLPEGHKGKCDPTAPPRLPAFMAGTVVDVRACPECGESEIRCPYCSHVHCATVECMPYECQRAEAEA